MTATECVYVVSAMGVEVSALTFDEACAIGQAFGEEVGGDEVDLHAHYGDGRRVHLPWLFIPR